MKKEQERKAAERRRIIEERCGKPKNIDDANEGKVIVIYFKKKKKKRYINTTPLKLEFSFVLKTRFFRTANFKKLTGFKTP